MTGKAVNIPGLTMGNEGSESLTDAEAVNRIMETRLKVTQEFREAETRKKLKDCQKIPVRTYQHQGNYIAGDKIWFQHNEGNAWHGPAEVVHQKGNTIFAYFNGEMRKVAMCRAKPYELVERIEGETKKNNKQEETHDVIEETKETENHENTENNESNETESDEKIENNEVEIVEENETEKENKIETRKDLKNDIIGAKYLQIEKSVYFMDYQIYSVEVPLKDHGKKEIVAAKNKEMDNLKFYETYIEVKDEGQETIGSRWVITEKQEHDGQKQDYKARLVAKGFQELDQPQSDSPTAAKESFKLIMALSANYNFKIVSVDIRAAFLQAKTLDREVYVKPPKDQEKEGIIW